MAQTSTIEWTELTWNPCAGCTMCSPGCAHCYALPMAHRLHAMGQPKYQGTTTTEGGRLRWTGKIVLDEKALDQPRRWLESRTIFVNSMSDLFHEAVPVEFIVRVFAVMADCPQHTFQVLTKRSQRLLELSPRLPWPENVWMGVSVENAESTFRIDELRATGAWVKFLSLEPLLGPIPSLNLRGINWVIVGGESGPGARPMAHGWVTSIQEQCVRARIPFFFKQWGHVRNNPNGADPTAKQNGGTAKGGRLLDGETWDDTPLNWIPF
ncbi:MAG: phage Gp37/Gp68 family protein [Phycisphaerae bacterium]|nr:phage Gp37/Gp68 family protein [Phycisphaerae bacterium]